MLMASPALSVLSVQLSAFSSISLPAASCFSACCQPPAARCSAAAVHLLSRSRSRPPFLTPPRLCAFFASAFFMLSAASCSSLPHQRDPAHGGRRSQDRP